MNDKIESTINVLPPFKRMCMTIGELPASYLETMTYYETLLWFTKYLQETVIPTINNNALAVAELQELFEKLQNYVNTYFDNLDIQQEIDNKLDEMVETGEIDELIVNAFNRTPLTHLNLENIFSKNIDKQSTTYEEHSYRWSQGMCYYNGNVIVAFSNEEGDTNLCRLCEYSLSTGTLLRETYLEIYHANSITIKDGKLYIAFCNENDGNGNVIANNNIGVVDYTNLTLDDTIEINNIPDNHRIRSCYYDEVNDKFYAGDVYTLFEIDLENNSIIDTINLDTTYVNTTETNQTIKVHNNMIIGLYFYSIVYWDMHGNLIRIQNLNQIVQNEHFGEPEDFYIYDNNNILISANRTLSSQGPYKLFSIYKSNITINTSNIIPNEMGGADTTSTRIYVNGSYTGVLQEGTQAKPFSTIQRALSYARNVAGAQINVLEGNYENVYITNIHKVIINCADNTSINGIQVYNGSAQINISGSATISGLRCENAELRLKANTNCVINPYTDSTTWENNICNFINAKVYLANCTINSNEIQPCVNVSTNSRISLYNCTFNGYTDTYAIKLDSNSICNVYEPTFNIASSSTQHIYYVAGGSILNKRISDNDYNNVYLQSQGRVFPSNAKMTVLDNNFVGNLTTLDSHYNYVLIETKAPQTNSNHKFHLIPIFDINNAVISDEWVASDKIYKSMITIGKTGDIIKINVNRLYTNTYSTNTQTYEELDTEENGQANSRKWMSIIAIFYLQL